ncbi:MAG: ABC transporter substrate-binding protein [Nitrospirae bacterium]|nr:ABC transporter substrate-binding protein [Nitrospirota bacterium]
MTITPALRRNLSLLLLAVALAGISSCSASTGKIEGYVYYRLGTNPTSLDPAFIVDVQGGAIAAKIYNGLVRLDTNLNVTADIAESWQISQDARTYTFKLRHNVSFHNGKPLMAADAAYSLTRILSPETHSPNAWVLKNLEGAGEFLKGNTSTLAGITVHDNYTLSITLKEPFEPFLKLLTMPAAYIVPNGGTGVLGTGPFILDKWEPDRELILRRNDNHFEGPARVNGIFYKIIPEDLTAVTEFLLGNIDVIDITVSSYSMFTRDAKYRDMLRGAPGLNVYYLGFNTSRPPLDNPLLRRAIAHAIDRQKILDTYFQHRGKIAAAPVPDELKKYTLNSPYPFDRDKARQLLRESGYNPLTKLRFYVTAVQESIDIAEIIASYLKDVGINVEIKTLEWSAYKSAINNGETDMFWLGWWADYPDSENFLFPLYHSSNFGAGGNRTRYKNPEADELIDKGRKSTNEAQRQGLYKAAEEQILKDAPAVYFWQRSDYFAVQPRIKNFKVYPIYNMDKGNLLEIQTQKIPFRPLQ